MLAIIVGIVMCGAECFFANCCSNPSDKEMRQLEAVKILKQMRIKSIFNRFAPKPPGVIYDIGGGPGVYSCALAKEGYKVHLIDIAASHIMQAIGMSLQSSARITECSVGDARNISASDAVADIVLLLGPLHHLQDRNDRVKALNEAYRILKPGGTIFAVALSCLFFGFQMSSTNRLTDERSVGLVNDIFYLGTNNNPTLNDIYFRKAYFHHPYEFVDEMRLTKFQDLKLLSVEGIGGLNPDLSTILSDQKLLDGLLNLIIKMEDDSTLLGISRHIMAIGKK